MPSSEQSSPTAFDVNVIGGATVLVEYAGMRLLTDPTFDRAGHYAGPTTIQRTVDAPLGPNEIGAIDAVLLSHDEHPDNLDLTGRAFLANAPIVLTTRGAAERLGGAAHGLLPWQFVELQSAEGAQVRVTAVRAQHGPDGSRPIVGDVIGFVLESDNEPVVYISGDNASLDVVREVSEVFDVDVAILFAGAVRMAVVREEPDLLTLDAQRTVEAVKILNPRSVVVAHVDGWAHFNEDFNHTISTLKAAGLADLVQRPARNALAMAR